MGTCGRRRSRRSSRKSHIAIDMPYMPTHTEPGSDCDAVCILSIVLGIVAVGFVIGFAVYFGRKGKTSTVRNLQEALGTAEPDQIVTIETEEEVDGKTVIKPKKYKKRKKRKKKKTDRDSYEMVLCTPPPPKEDTFAWTCAKRVFSVAKLVTVCAATYLLFFQGWFAVNAACDTTVGSIEKSEEEKGWYDKVKDGVRSVTGKTGDSLYADYFGTPEERVCSYYNKFGGVEMGRAVFNPALQKTYDGKTLETRKEFQDAWKTSYAGDFIGTAENPRDNMRSQLFTSVLSFLSGYGLLKWVYPSYAEKLMAGIISAGVLMAQWEAKRFGAVSWIAGAGLGYAAMFGGVPASLAPGLTKAGGAMKNFGAQHGGFNAQNPMTGMMQPQMRMVKKKKQSKDSDSTSAGSSSD